MGVSNFFDVISNIPFLIFGLLGLFLVLFNSSRLYSLSWTVLFAAVLLVSAGSAYYHLNPNNSTLVWDRLPMAIGFMALFVIIIGDYINKNLERILLIPMCLFGMFSVYYWNATDDLRLYAWVQFISMALALFIILAYKPTQLKSRFLYMAFIFYALSKLTEFFDGQIFSLTAETISGHTIKHLLASISTFFFYMLAKFRDS